MVTSTLTKFKNKVKLRSTPKHPFYFEVPEHKTVYGAGVVLHAYYHPDVKPLSNPELLRLLSKGFVLSPEQTSAVLSSALKKQETIDRLLELLEPSIGRFYFLMDLINVSMRDGDFTEEENYSIRLFSDLFGISEETVKAMRFFLRSAYHEDEKMLLLAHNDLLATLPEEYVEDFALSHLKYYTCFLNTVTVITQKQLSPKPFLSDDFSMEAIMNSYLKGLFHNYFTDHCELSGDMTLPKGCCLCFHNATVKIYGTLRLTDATLIFSNCSVTLKQSLRYILSATGSSLVILEHTQIDLRHLGSFLEQHGGTLTANDCSLISGSKKPALCLTDNSFSLHKCEFRTCHTPKNGAAVCIQGGSGQISECSFYDCESQNGGAVYTTQDTILKGCVFYLCKAVRYGSAIFCDGEIRSNLDNCHFYDCFPENEEVMQVLKGPEVYHITKTHVICYSTIIDTSLEISDLGILELRNATIYLRHPIRCKGVLNIRNCTMIAQDFTERDMVIMERAKSCSITYSEFNAANTAGIFRACGTRMNLFHCIFRNCRGGSAIYDAYLAVISECIFSYCQDGAVYCHSSKISNSTFVNCTGKIGAAIRMEGKSSEVNGCHFLHCISYYKPGAIDLSGSRHIYNCTFASCDPQL